jgi:hypothetical protein
VSRYDDGLGATGGRLDAGKVRLELLPFDSLWAVAEVGTLGAAKYSDRNWEKGMAWSRVVGSALRHLFARIRGERLDPETKLPHLAHFAWNALALLTYDLRGVGEDDITRGAPVGMRRPADQREAPEGGPGQPVHGGETAFAPVLSPTLQKETVHGR